MKMRVFKYFIPELRFTLEGGMDGKVENMQCTFVDAKNLPVILIKGRRALFKKNRDRKNT